MVVRYICIHEHVAVNGPRLAWWLWGKIMAPKQHALSHGVSAPPQSLRDDLALIASLAADHVQAFCAMARKQLQDGEEGSAAAFAKAAGMLGVDAETVATSVRALCYVMVSAVVAGRAPADLLQGIELELPAASLDALVSFYQDVAPEIEREVRSGLTLPRYDGIEWRLQARLASRFTPRQPPQPSFLLRLRTSGGEHGVGGAEHLLHADLPNLRRLTSELEGALVEEKSTHSRRIARRL